MLKFLVKTVLLLLLILPFAIGTLLALAPQQHSLIDNLPTLTQQDVKKARTLLAQHDPRKLRSGTINSLQLDAQSLSLLGTYGLQTLSPVLGSAGMQARLFDDSLQLQASMPLPDNPLGRYLNLQLYVSKLNNKLVIGALQLGPWKIPDWISRQLPAIADQLLSRHELWQLAQAALVDFDISEQALSIDYRWQSEWEHVARQKIRELTDHGSMEFYAGVLYALPFNEGRSFSTVVSSLFKQALQRSTDNDAIAENRAILQLLGQWALGKQTYGKWYLPYFSARLKGRVDLAQHLLVSAAIASQSNRDVSNLIGTGKELSDSDGGSGFDFSDLAADRVGSLLGKLATQDTASAIRLQQLLSETKYSGQLLPDISGLPTPLSDTKFIQQYGNLRDKRYEKQLQEIDLAIKSLPLFQQMKM